MIKKIKKIKDFGTFKDFQAVGNEPYEFDVLNILYGWNYSGKTTFSRIFSSIENRQIHSDFASGTFEVAAAGESIDSSDLTTHTQLVRVFNNEYINDNLDWSSGEMAAITLGKQVKDQDEQLSKLEAHIEKARKIVNKWTQRASRHLGIIKSRTTDKAAEIKKLLQMTEAFNATHLNKLIARIKNNPQEHLLDQESISQLLPKATRSDAERRPTQPTGGLRKPTAVQAPDDLVESLKAEPEAQNVIEYLKQNPQINSWVETGLSLNEPDTPCKFCNNIIRPERIAELNAHFSQALKSFVANLQRYLPQIASFKLQEYTVGSLTFYPELSEEVAFHTTKYNEAITKYNAWLDELSDTIKEKINNPFEPRECPRLDDGIIDSLTEHASHIETLIKKHNQLTDEFDNQKKAARKLIANSVAAEFYLNLVFSREKKSALIEKRLGFLTNYLGKKNQEAASLKASISNAHNGAGELSKYIGAFITQGKLSIKVIEIDGVQRFQLLRDGNPARNLSEGEKSIISFAYFLVRLQEEDQSKLIVYIDDPMSSLDSNHIFQMYGVLHEEFTRLKAGTEKTYELSIKQLFISTHNFEFLRILKKFGPKKHFYLIKRISGDESTIEKMPKSISMYDSEYQLLWGLIHKFNLETNKQDFDQLASMPNVVRRFLELYTAARYPSDEHTSLDDRLVKIAGRMIGKRIPKLLHHFSHANNISALTNHNAFMSDIEEVVKEVVDLVSTQDALHHEGLMNSVAPPAVATAQQPPANNQAVASSASAP